jgi:hypothetical protein
MLVKFVRQSGRPVKTEHMESYAKEWPVLYDKCEKKSELIFQKSNGKLTRTPKMFVLQRMVRFAEHLMSKKYGLDTKIEIPKTAKQWNKLIEESGNCPILIAKTSEKNSEVVLVIMDNQFSV